MAKEVDSQGVQIVSAYTVKGGRWLGSELVTRKSNEIPAAQVLLRRAPIEGMLVTADALHTQTETARVIVQERGANYLMTVKGNQPTNRGRRSQPGSITYRRAESGNDPARHRQLGGPLDRPVPQQTPSDPSGLLRFHGCPKRPQGLLPRIRLQILLVTSMRNPRYFWDMTAGFGLSPRNQQRQARQECRKASTSEQRRRRLGDCYSRGPVLYGGLGQGESLLHRDDAGRLP